MSVNLLKAATMAKYKCCFYSNTDSPETNQTEQYPPMKAGQAVSII